METAYDWITVLLFAALATLFLQRSIGPARAGDRTLLYVPPALTCGLANVAGNKGFHLTAMFLIGSTILYVLICLRPGRAPN